jgi:hypothetical protein
MANLYQSLKADGMVTGIPLGGGPAKGNQAAPSSSSFTWFFRFHGFNPC